MQPPYPPPPQPAPPSERRVPPVVWVAAGAFALLIVAGAAILLIESRPPSDPKAKGTFQLRKVLTRSDGACPTSSADTVSSAKSDACYTLGDGMTITKMKSVEMRAENGNGWVVEFDLRPEDTGRLSTLTGQLVREQSPRNQLAMVSNGRVISAPEVQDPIADGKLMLSGNFSRAEAERYVNLFD